VAQELSLHLKAVLFVAALPVTNIKVSHGNKKIKNILVHKVFELPHLFACHPIFQRLACQV